MTWALGSYQPIFMVAGGAYLVALLLIHLLTPRLRPVRAEELTTRTGEETAR